ncbi:MAG TPA: hypothetical protein VN032_11100 [Thermoanaerobaculia bacterium]|jgi:hypothetical protein|nr:hypothetical protein [Thermoanaerobaculia bacterium]
MDRRIPSGAVLLFCLGLVACASGSAKKPDTGLGMRLLDCVVVDREHDSPGANGSSYRGNGNYYLVFEAKEGQATSRYRLEVTRQQYVRFEDGAHVRITLTNNILTDIRPID